MMKPTRPIPAEEAPSADTPALSKEDDTDTTQKKVIEVSLSPSTVTELNAKIQHLERHTVIGQITGKHPGIRYLLSWARHTLHRSFLSITSRSNNYFELIFSDSMGAEETLAKKFFELQNQEILILPWSPYFDAKGTPLQRRTALWVQIIDLPPWMRTKTILSEIISTFAEIVHIDDSESYLSKISGPRVRILTTSIDSLPSTVKLNRIDGKGIVLY
ncbi:hypothetical protein M758_UG138800 [Ceratodon purpureus]|nr:hypothetical protein M758_UG138800 [Ceratodon purpureus]